MNDGICMTNRVSNSRFLGQQCLAGKVALVTGGSRGIGAAVCEALASMGADIAVNYSKNSAKAEELCQALFAAGVKAHPFQFDVSDSAAVDEGLKNIAEKLGAVSILVNNAGIAADSLLMRTKDEAWKMTIDVNLSSAFYCSRAASRAMIKGGWGRIVNISSVIGEMGNAGQVAYSASKSAMFGMTKSLAREFASRGVTVNAVTPGYIDTDMTAVIGEQSKERLLANIPVGRLGVPDDVAGVVAFLCSPIASYITGAVIPVNGGLRM